MRADQIMRPGGEVRTVVFMDLDDSIFQTARKCGSGPLKAAALGLDGAAASFFTPAQRRLLEILDRQAMVIPTTARNRNAFSRVLINADYGAILNYGGLILGPDGQPDSRWHSRMRERCSEAAPLLREAQKRIEQIISARCPACRSRIIGDDGLDFYVVVKNYDSRPEELETVKAGLAEFGAESGLQIFLNDNNLAILPPFLNKAGAVSYFLETYIRPPGEGLLVIGLGDSLSDLKFMRLCDYMLIPSRSQLAGSLNGQER